MLVLRWTKIVAVSWLASSLLVAMLAPTNMTLSSLEHIERASQYVAARLTDDVLYLSPFISALGIFRGVRGDFIGNLFKSNAGAPLPDQTQIQMLSTHNVTDSGPTAIPITFQ